MELATSDYPTAADSDVRPSINSVGMVIGPVYLMVNGSESNYQGSDDKMIDQHKQNMDSRLVRQSKDECILKPV
ncbi:uncharacterized protein PHALS_05052 [Plasmopara halstedii]|uniref:Uncharacterized protein n=1 Tax=Plasmopara halstedii TaxID=4781 RepID=A0A0N7L421_PLAHL|nr:uncharacterized protein PHALS_05052 [Plasmopara halstedii]CEG37459.1 hypothetical protein PHALS_05052 [Plasmopara halstedii]|eukprot:XP_024573828.1 hypothetical protein PHALS_05052 [Plasmopara halstedii]